MMKDIVEMIIQKSKKSIKNFRIESKTIKKNYIYIYFEDGTCATSIVNIWLMSFLTILKDQEIIDYEGNDCIKEPLGFYSILGYEIGNKIKIIKYNNIFLNIQFI